MANEPEDSKPGSEDSHHPPEELHPAPDNSPVAPEEFHHPPEDSYHHHYSGETDPIAPGPAEVPAVTQAVRQAHSDVDEEEEGGGPVKSFLEHLEDLRWTIIKSSAALVVAMIVCLVAAPKVFSVMSKPLELANLGLVGRPPIKLEWFSPTGGFMSSLRLAFYSGLVIGLPFILYFLGEFVVPALKAKEKKFFFGAFTIGTVFFLAGVVICYFLIMPISLRALVQYNSWLGIQTTTWRAEDYFEFATKFLLGVGLLFEVPVLILTLIKVDLVQTETLVRGRRYMFVGNFVICAILTPADLVTTFLMAIVLQVLYEGCIWIARYWDRQRRHRMEAEAGLTPPRSDQL